MHAAHVCTSCGHDLSAVAPVREQVYALLVRFCPGCAHPHPVWPGGKHPITAAWRRTRLLVRTARGLVHALGALALVCLAGAGLAQLGPELRSVGLAPAQLWSRGPLFATLADVPGLILLALQSTEWMPIPLAIVAAVAVLAGLIAADMFRHLTLAGGWLLVASAMVATATFEGMLRLPMSLTDPSWRVWSAAEWQNALGLPLLVVLLMPMGFLPARLLVAGAARRRSKRFARALRRCRQRKRT